MNEKQIELLHKLADVFDEIAEQCDDETFHEIMIDNNDLIPMSIDELAAEYRAIANGEKRTRIDGK